MADKVDKDTQIKYLESAMMLGFGLWFAVMLLGVFLPKEDMSERAVMWIVIITMSYAVLIVGATFWSGYSRKERELVNADPNERKSRLASLRFSALFGFTFMLILHLVIDDDPWTSAVLQALFFAVFTTLTTYLMSLRKPKQGGA